MCYVVNVHVVCGYVVSVLLDNVLCVGYVVSVRCDKWLCFKCVI